MVPGLGSHSVQGGIPVQALGGVARQSSVPVAGVPCPSRYGKMAGASPLWLFPE